MAAKHPNSHQFEVKYLLLYSKTIQENLVRNYVIFFLLLGQAHIPCFNTASFYLGD